MEQESITDDQAECELLRYEMRKFSIKYSKELAKTKKSQKSWNCEKSSKFFLNLEKYRATQNKIRNVLEDWKEFTSQTQFSEKIFSCNENLFPEKTKSSKWETSQYWNDCSVSTLNNGQILEWKNILLENEFLDARNKMPSNKFPGNAGLTKEFYVTSWDDVKTPLILRFKCSFKKSKLNISQNYFARYLLDG